MKVAGFLINMTPFAVIRLSCLLVRIANGFQAQPGSNLFEKWRSVISDKAERPQKLCLIPHKVVDKSLRIVYLIASCYHSNTALVIGDPESNHGSRSTEWKEKVDVFNTGSPRVRRVFPAIGLHKFIHVGAADQKGL